MASSNRHWPSMFKSKPCNTHHHQWQHDINSSLISTNCHRSPFSSGPGGEERSPEPKPRWNPKPEQIRILEAIFNSGMVNPPRDEIRRIRGQLQEYGQVGDANVFYWFQNRKSRSKHKQRHLLQNTKNNNSQNQTPPPPPPPPTNTTIINTTSSIITAPSSSSSSSEKSSPKAAAAMNNNNNNNNNKIMSSFSVGSSNPIHDHHLSNNSPTGSVNQTTYFQPSSSHSHGELIMPEPFFFPVQQTTDINNTNGNGVFSSQGFCFSDLSNVVQFPDHHHHHQAVGSSPGFLLSELMMNNSNNQGGSSKKVEEEKMKLHHQLSYTPHAHHVPTIDATTVTVPLNVNQVQGVGEITGGVGPLGSARSTVFINDVAFEVSVGSFNVRDCFGDDAVLIHSSGQTVLTNEWGVTLQPLQHGACYYLI